MSSSLTCPICGQTLPVDASQGLCPACLLRAGVPTTIHPAAGGTLPFVPPTLTELAPHFPQLEIIELVGQGGMGAVYRARQPKLDRLVALKILSPQPRSDPGFAERFTREARALARLNHPNIVAVHDFGQAGAFHFLLMEFVDGVNLRHLIQTRRIEPREALAIVPPICDALQYAHDRGIVHRDIKPENILLDKNGAVKIADFGLAKLTGIDAHNFTMTSDRDVMGTPHYMAPEQVERPMAVDHRADIYSLGVVFYQMLTGELPLGRFAPPSRKVQIDVRLDEIVLRALEKEPEQRYQQATGLKTALETVATRAPATTTPSPVARSANGINYRSPITLFGLPLLHIATGLDPVTGKWRSAKGIVAIGHTAFGVVAIGGVAYGGIAIGGASFGAIAFGGTSLGIFALGGMAIGGLFAAGGVAVATIATGGSAFGYFALGSGAFGGHAIGNNVSDPVAREFFAAWAGPLVLLSGWLAIAAILVAQIVSVAVGLWTRRQSPPNRPWARGLGIAAWSAAIAGLLAVNSMALHVWWGAQSEIGARLAFFTSASAASARAETPNQFVQVQAWLVEHPAELKLTAENFDRQKLAGTAGVAIREFLPKTAVRSGGTLEHELVLAPAGPSVRFLLSTLRRRDFIRCAVRVTFQGGGVSRIGFERSERVPPEEPLILELGSFTPGRKHAAVFRFQSWPTGARRNSAAPESPTTTAPVKSPTAVSAARGNASGPPASASAADFDGMESNPEILRIQLRHAEIEHQRAASRAAAGIVSESEAQRAADRVSLLRAKLDGNRRRFAQIQVDSAERNFRDAGQRRNAGFANDTELESLAADLEIARIRLRAEDARAP